MINKLRNPNFILFFLLSVFQLEAQNKHLTIDDCYSMAKENYPLIRQRELIKKTKEYSLEKASRGYLPQISINGQSTYQSEVTQVPIEVPGTDIPELSKDQYKIYGDINQVIYDGGMIRQQRETEKASAVVEEQKLEVELYKIKDRINQLFFGVLIADEQLKQNEILKKDIMTGIEKTNAMIKNGTALKSAGDVLEADLLKANQRTIELRAAKTANIDMLSMFINHPLGTAVVFVKPSRQTYLQDVKRPELIMYDYQNNLIDIQNKMLIAKNRPKLNFFLQTGYGRPALNMLSNSFEPYYLGGLRFSWSLSGLYTLPQERGMLGVNRKNIEVQRAVFLFNTDVALRQQNTEITKLEALLALDDELITLRSNIKKNSAALLENGVIMISDYLREVNAENQARQNKILHEIQLLMAEYNQKTTTGN